MTEFNMAARDSIIPEGYTYSELRPLIETTLRSGISVLLRGHPGVGKSSLAQELATAMNLELIDIRLAQRDPAELCGVYFPDHERQALELFAPAWVKQAVEKPCLVFLDEINAAVTKLHQAAAYQIVLEHRVGQFRFHPETVVMGAGNLEEDNAIVASLSSALCNRFAHFILRPDVSDWLSWGGRHGIDGVILGYIGAQGVDVLYNNNGEFAFPTPRSWEMASRVFARAADCDRKRAVAACIGPSAANRFFTYYKIYGQFDVEGVVNRGQKISFDSYNNFEPSYIFAAVFAVSGYIFNLESLTPEQVTNTVGFIDSNVFDPEHRFLFLQQLKRRSDLFDLFRPNRHFQRLAANLVDFRSVRVSKPEEQDILEKCLAAVRQDGRAIKHLTNAQRTPAVCLAAVRQNGRAIEYLTDVQRTPGICLTAVQQNGYAIEYLTDAQRMEEICLVAVKQDGRAILYLTDAQRTPGICLAAVQQNGHIINSLTDAQRTPEVCLAAVQQNGHIINSLTDAQRTPEVCLAAVKQNGGAIMCLTDTQRTPEVCLAAVRQNGYAIRYLTYAQSTPEVCFDAVRQNYHNIRYLSDTHRTPEVCLVAVQQNGKILIDLIDAQRTPEVCLEAVRRNGKIIQHLTDAQRTPEVCLAAVRQVGDAIRYLTDAQRTPEVCYYACCRMRLDEERMKFNSEIWSRAQQYNQVD